VARGDEAVRRPENRHLPPFLAEFSLKHFHLNVVGYVEPRPGIPPSPQHTVELIQQMKRGQRKSDSRGTIL